MALALCPLPMVVVPGPRFVARRLPGKLIQGIAQRFETRNASMGCAVVSALIGYRSRACQRLHTAPTRITGTVISLLRKPPGSQPFPGTRQACKDRAVGMGQKRVFYAPYIKVEAR